MLFAIAIQFTRMNHKPEVDKDLVEMWNKCFAFDKKWANHFRNRTALWFLCLPGKFGRGFNELIYAIANMVVRYN
jgi:hypothetical protein